MTAATSTPATAGRATSTRHRPSLVVLLGVEVRDEMRMIRREPAALFFSVLMPVMFYALFVGLFGGESATDSNLPVGTLMLATFGAYGAIVSTMMNPGIGLASARASGWFEGVKVSPVPVVVNLAAKVLATIPFVAGILTAMTLTSAAMGVLEITVGQWLALMAALVIGSQSFALVGLAIGALASPNATTAILNAVIMPAAIASGLWFPLEIMPDWVATIAPFLPTYHLAQLAAVPLEGGPWLMHLVVLVGFTVVAGAGATIAWRRSTT